MPLWVSDLAEIFWSRAGEIEPFPWSLRLPIAKALPVSLVFLPKLRPAVADAWLARQGVPCALAATDRPLRACLVARDGNGFIFVDGTDAADEQRFSLAHELAHFLRDYWQPRQAAAERLGADVLAVLDGKRSPSQEERIRALLARTRLAFHTHLMERTANGRSAGADVDAAERDADRLAFELLAPAEAVILDTLPHRLDQRGKAIAGRLSATFGLPAASARQYAAILAPPPAEPDPLLRRLGLVPMNVELFEVDGK